jgi:chemotaxis protein methyltransferase WspC
MSLNVSPHSINLVSSSVSNPILDRIAHQLKSRTGLDSQSLDLSGAIRLRMRHSGVCTLAEYAARLQISPHEWESLIDAVVIPETNFFRDRKPFEYLAQWVKNTWMKRRSPVLRVLSLPCSTGEESYSIAMTLLSTGLNPAQISIDAVDISTQSIAVAKLGQYRSISHTPQYWSSYWLKTAKGIEILPWVRRLIDFRPGNGLMVLGQSTALPYDVIFCRNLLIYFDTSHRQILLQGIDRNLTRSGLFIVGHSEMGIVPRDRFTPVAHSHSCAFHPMVTSKVTSKVASKAIVSPSSPVWDPWKPPSSADLDSDLDSGFDRSKQLADAGDLVEATLACDAYIRQRPLCAAGHVLSAQIHFARGHATIAEQSLERAIYLDPLNESALLQLLLLREGRGDRSGARSIQQRLQRLRGCVQFNDPRS